MNFNPFRRRRADDVAFRTYAIGDIHGCSGLLAALIELIEQDVERRPPMANRLVVLGDFIDRGPDSARIVDLFMRIDGQPNVVVLKGNHEATMVDALDGDAAAMEAWLEFGGRATLESYGLTVAASDNWDLRALMRAAREAVPAPVLRWLRSRPSSFASGKYFFVHAGVRPGAALSAQADDDLLWIRDEFTASEADYGAVIVHGHTVYENGVSIAPNRIGVDTGAYRTGCLSAVGIEAEEIWALSTAPTAPAPVQ